MRRFLVVGCGGTGGKTLAYMMDQLRSDLGTDRLPAGWQFVHLDVPLGIERGPDGLGNVVQQGGRYLGLGTQGGRYADLDDALSRRLESAGGIGDLATWAPRRPDLESTPIDVGAGQYRAIGRAILLAKAGEVRTALQQAWLTLAHADTTSEMERVAARTRESFNPIEPPLVLVVSSMAGGSGASMALDVCRLLTQIPNVNPSLVALFAATPDVFDTLPPTARFGVRANALAMLGEIIASQTGAAQRHDSTILAHLGLRDGGNIAVPFARVFPVGRSVGVEKAQFGDGSTDAVYRGLARGLAGLMESGVASDQFTSFDLGNTGSVPPVPRYLGWGSESTAALPWGSYGFASITMGRDRYAEYAAQRLARACVDRLLDGHLQAGSEASGVEQAQRLLDSQWATVCRQLQIPSLSGPGALAERDTWFKSSVLPASIVESDAAQIAASAFQFERPDNEHWLDHVRRGMQSGRSQAVQQADQAAYRGALSWQLAFVRRVEQALGEAVARFGLTYGAALLERLQTYVGGTLGPAVAGIGTVPVDDPSELPDNVVKAATTRGAVRGNDQFFRTILETARSRLAQQIYVRAARHLGMSLRESVPDALQPMRDAVQEGYETVVAARASQAGYDGLARLTTDQYTAWPSAADTAVPRRFGEANNELMLTPSSQFPSQFAVDIKSTLDADEAGPDPEATAVYQVLLGEWRSGAAATPGGLVVPTYGWWPREFSFDPSTDQTVRAQRARYTLGVEPGEVRGRAKLFVDRAGQSFSKFCDVTMKSFVEAKGESALERERRWDDVVTKFRRALTLAIPLASVDAQAVRVLHGGGQEVRYRYKFSAVPPFAQSASLGQVLRDNQIIDHSSEDRFAEAVERGAQTDPHRIDIFGSYPLYSPLAFDSLLDPVTEQWDATPPEGAEAFWHLRRARPLDASLPVAAAERRAMVAGWYVGQIVGEIRIPGEPYSDPVQIWDPEDRRWVSFPWPMLTSPRLFRGQLEWLPAVLESMLIAVARVHQAPVMESLRPYHLLRELYDADALRRPEGLGLQVLSAERRLSTWLQRGSVSGSPSRVSSIAAATSTQERYDAANSWLTGDGGPGFLAREHFLHKDLGGSGAGAFSEIKTRKQAGQVPMFADLAADIGWATTELETILVRAHRRRPEADQVDDTDFVVLPDLGAL